MEERKLKIQFGKSGNGGINPRLSIPKKWLDIMEIDQQNNQIIVIFDEKSKSIKIQKQVSK